MGEIEKKAKNKKRRDELKTSKCRGVSIRDDEWVYGDYFVGPLTLESAEDSTSLAGHYFLSGEIEYIHCISVDGLVYEVYPETVGRYTGIDDINGKEIYEGDIVELLYRGETKITELVKFWEGQFVTQGIGKTRDGKNIVTSLNSSLGLKVDGNLHEFRTIKK